MNDELMINCGLAKWHKTGYTGRGIRIAVFDDRPFITEDMKGYASIPCGISDIQESHNSKVAKCLHEAAPEAEVFCLSARTADADANVEWILANDIDIVSSSYSPPFPTDTKGRYKRLKDSGIIFCSCAGNEGAEGIEAHSAWHWTIAIGAAAGSGEKKESYSNTGEELDCLAFIPKIKTANSPQGVRLTGTSFAQPFAAGMIACYMQYAKENGLPHDRQSIKKFIAENCKDIYTEGKDNQSGYGVLMMPDMPEKQRGGADMLTTTKLLLNGKEKEVKTIQHEGHNYIKLRDLVDELISVDYSAEKRLPILEVRGR